MLRLTHLDKVFYPATGFTKRDVLKFYRRIATAILPHLERRALTLKRYPNGVDEESFYEKRCPSHRPSWIATVVKDELSYCCVETLPALMWTANLASIELHTLLSRAPDFQIPTFMVFDLDPGPGVGLLDCANLAIRLRELLEKNWSLMSYPKTSGSKGIQVYVPLNPGDPAGASTFSDTKSFSRQIAEKLERKFPETLVSRMAKNLRPGKIFIDWSQNDENKTTVCAYSLRATERPNVSTPVRWSELEQAVKTGRPDKLVFEPAAVIARFERWGDLFEPVLRVTQELPSLRTGKAAKAA